MAQVATSARAWMSRDTGALKLGIEASKLDAECGGLAMNAVAAPYGRRVFMLEGAALERLQQPIDVFYQNIARARELNRKAGVEQIRGRHTLVDEARLGPDDFRQMRKEGHDIVLHFALDFVDARHIEIGARAFAPDGARGGLGNDADFGQRIGRVRLDLEPDAKFRFRRPDRRHLCARITRNHFKLSPIRPALCTSLR